MGGLGWSFPPWAAEASFCLQTFCHLRPPGVKISISKVFDLWGLEGYGEVQHPYAALAACAGRAGFVAVMSLGAASGREVTGCGRQIPQFLCRDGAGGSEGEPFVATGFPG